MTRPIDSFRGEAKTEMLALHSGIVMCFQDMGNFPAGESETYSLSCVAGAGDRLV